MVEPTAFLELSLKAWLAALFAIVGYKILIASIWRGGFFSASPGGSVAPERVRICALSAAIILGYGVSSLRKGEGAVGQSRRPTN